MRRSISKTQRPRSGLSLTIVLSAAIHVVLFGLLAYNVAADKEEEVIFSPPYSVSLVSGEEPGEGGQDGVEPPVITERLQPAEPAETKTEAETVTIPVEKPAEIKKETPPKPEKPAAPAVTEEKKKPVEEKKKETTEDLASAIEKIRKKIEAEEAARKKEEEQKKLAEKAKETASLPAKPKAPATTPPDTGTTPAPGKPGGGNPYGYDNVFTAGGSGSGVPDADLSAYYNDVWERIRSVWAMPDGMRSSSLLTVYGIRIDRQGRIVDVWMESGSGNGTFDDSAFRAIKKADPLPPIPEKYTDITMDMGIRFHSDKR
jgi:TonB family protein